ncbi:MAG: LPS export ABC transporter periplasmic protein LptC [Candidatus Magnetoovum sp. WYHC-5]|nr:LPS export ABC transporter periplasmic protein LptC [Candidatus Magnetoovum sp. WYHC-5]
MKRAYGLILLVLLLVIAVGLYFILNKDDGHKIITLTSSSQMEGIKIEHVKGSQKTWVANIAKALLMENNKDIMLKNMVIEFYEQQIQVSSNEGKYLIEKNILNIPDNVIASTNKYSIHTSNVLVDLNSEKLSTLSEVSIFGKGVEIRADNISELNKQRMVLTGNVKVTFK